MKEPGGVGLGKREGGENRWKLRSVKGCEVRLGLEKGSKERVDGERTMQSPNVRVDVPAAMDARIEV